MDTIIWRPVTGFEGYYEVSSDGQVKSLPREGYRKKHPMFLKQQIDKDGYRYVKLHSKILKKAKRIHVLVLQAFTPNPENKPMVNHKNGVKYDNRLENLEWSTNSENQLHSIHVLKNPVNKFPEDLSLGKNGRATPIVQITLSGKFVKRFDCCISAGIELGIRKPRYIQEVVKMKRVFKNHRWILEKDYQKTGT